MAKASKEARDRAAKNYYERHKEEIRRKARENYERNREQKLARIRAYRSTPEGKAKHMATCKKWYEGHKQEHRNAMDRWFRNNPEKRREYRLRHRHGITVDQWQAILARQNGQCPICSGVLDFSVQQGVHLDHCHRTGQRRGLLCNLCNRGLGWFQDDPERLERAAAYLREYAANGVTSHPDAGTPARIAAEGSSC